MKKLTVVQIEALGYKKRHTSAARGYISRRTGAFLMSYKGRFGEGYKLLSPRWDTTRYIYVTYFIK